MEFIYTFDFEQLTGIPSDLLILGLAALVLILLIFSIINAVRTAKLRKSYRLFMEGKHGHSLEYILRERMQQVDQVLQMEAEHEAKIQLVLDHLDHTYQKVGVVKYNAFHEMGGKLSFSLALLNRKNDGFILNAMHSREGCFTYIKEVIAGNPVLMLAEEEREALDLALKDK